MGDEMNAGGDAGMEGTDVGSVEDNTIETEESGEVTGSPTEEILDKLARKYKVKLNGEEVEVDEDELIRNYQLRKVSDQKHQEGVRARKQAESFLKMLKSDPSKVLSDPRIGIDVKKFAEDIIYKNLQQEMMTPQQRELAEYKEKVQRYESEQKRIADEAANKEATTLHEQQRDTYVNDISDALSNAGLPKNDYTVQRIVGEMTKAIKAGFSNVKASDVVDLVHAQFVKDTKALYGSSSEETLMKLLGDEVAGKIRNYDVESYRQKNAIPKSTNVKGKKSGKPRTAKGPAKGPRELSPSQLRAKIEAEYGIG